MFSNEAVEACLDFDVVCGQKTMTERNIGLELALIDMADKFPTPSEGWTARGTWLVKARIRALYGAT